MINRLTPEVSERSAGFLDHEDGSLKMGERSDVGETRAARHEINVIPLEVATMERLLRCLERALAIGDSVLGRRLIDRVDALERGRTRDVPRLEALRVRLSELQASEVIHGRLAFLDRTAPEIVRHLFCSAMAGRSSVYILPGPLDDGGGRGRLFLRRGSYGFAESVIFGRKCHLELLTVGPDDDPSVGSQRVHLVCPAVGLVIEPE